MKILMSFFSIQFFTVLWWIKEHVFFLHVLFKYNNIIFCHLLMVDLMIDPHLCMWVISTLSSRSQTHFSQVRHVLILSFVHFNTLYIKYKVPFVQVSVTYEWISNLSNLGWHWINFNVSDLLRFYFGGLATSM